MHEVSREESFLQQRFSAHYEKHLPSVPEPLELREFGYGSFGRKIVNRNLFFRGSDELRFFLLNEKPLHLSCSVAYYPLDERRKRQWQGVDLVFEFDADAIPTKCKNSHDCWKCPNCGSQGMGSKELCDNCGKATKASNWVCVECLQKTKDETVKLVEDFLLRDFGFSLKDINCNFSGNRGFHTYVRSESVRQLDKNAILELVNYVQGNQLRPESHKFSIKKEKRHELVRGPTPRDLGWSGRIARSAVEYFSTASVEEIAKDLNVTISEAKKLHAARDSIIEGVGQGFWDRVKFGKTRESAAAEFWARIAKRFAVKGGADVDEQASTDIKKIMRVPNSLHGSTGLLARTFDFRQIDSFEPFTEGVVFSGEPLKVRIVEKTPVFTLKGENFGPFEAGFELELPEFAAIYLMARKSALLA